MTEAPVVVRLNSKLVRYTYVDGFAYSHWCPGCKHSHTYYVQCNNHTWTFDGNLDKPTFAPSMLEYYTKKDGTRVTCCHYFLKEGIIEFLGDCPHELKGQHVPLPDIPEDYGFGGMAFKDLPYADPAS